MAKLPGVERVFFCGPRATFTVSRGTSIKEDTVSKALTEQKMKLERFAREERSRPEFAYVMEVTGVLPSSCPPATGRGKLLWLKCVR